MMAYNKGELLCPRGKLCKKRNKSNNRNNKFIVLYAIKKYGKLFCS